MLHLDVLITSQVTGVLLPLLVGLVTKKLAASWFKAALLAFFAAIGGVLTSAINNSGTIVLSSAATAGLLSWVTATATYTGFWKPTGVADKVASLPVSLELGPVTKAIDVVGNAADDIEKVAGRAPALAKPRPRRRR